MLLLGDSAKLLRDFNDDCIDLTVTSPPYDNIRTYEGNSSFDFKTIAQELFRVTKKGGIVVWIIGDSTIDGSETGSSFKQVLYFKEIGFKLHDTMIYKKSWQFPQSTRYNQEFDYMFILSKGAPKSINLLYDRMNKHAIQIEHPKKMESNGEYTDRKSYIRKHFGLRSNIWEYGIGKDNTTSDKIAYNHPAKFPEDLAEDHIKSWSNEGDLILDPFCGSGTTCKAAHQLNRKWIGIEINPNYIEIAKKRLNPYTQQQRLLPFLKSEQV